MNILNQNKFVALMIVLSALGFNNVSAMEDEAADRAEMANFIVVPYLAPHPRSDANMEYGCRGEEIAGMKFEDCREERNTYYEILAVGFIGDPIAHTVKSSKPWQYSTYSISHTADDFHSCEHKFCRKLRLAPNYNEARRIELASKEAHDEYRRLREIGQHDSIWGAKEAQEKDYSHWKAVKEHKESLRRKLREMGREDHDDSIWEVPDWTPKVVEHSAINKVSMEIIAFQKTAEEYSERVAAQRHALWELRWKANDEARVAAQSGLSTNDRKLSPAPTGEKRPYRRQVIAATAALAITAGVAADPGRCTIQ